MGPVRVLVVDDEPDVRNAVRRGLELMGYELEVAVDGSEGMAMVERWHPDVVLMDLAMPHLGGLSAIEQIRSWSRVPIIVLFIGVSLLIQGAYTILYLRGDLDRWGDLATGALFAGEGLSAVVGAGGLIQSIIHNISNADMEMAPVLAGLLMLVQAVLALLFLLVTDRLRPRVNGRSAV